MRRLVIAVFGLLFVAESTGSTALAQSAFPSLQSPSGSTSASQRHAMDSGRTPSPPDFSEATKPHPHSNPELHRTFVTPVIRLGGILLEPRMQPRIPASLPPDPLAMTKKTNAAANASIRRSTSSALPSLFTPRPVVAFGKASQQTVKPMTVGANGGNGVTGQNAWWPYVQSGIPGAGVWYANVATGNLIVADTDVDVAGRGLDLSYDRVYNSMSQHTFSNADNSVPDVYGEGWTSTADAHLSYDSSTNVMTVWSGDGARYDFTSAGNGAWAPPAGAQGTKLQWDGGCGYYWTLKSGIVYYFNQNPYGCGGATYAAYSGRLYRIYGRNHNNYIQFNYYWNSDASTINNLNHIVMQHSDGQTLTLQFGNYNGYIELASITRPDGAQITYGYDGSGDLTSVNLPTNNSGYNSHGFGYYAGYAHRMNYVTAPLWTQSSGQKGSYTWFDYSGNNVSGVQLYGWANFTPDDGTNASILGTPPQAQQISYTSIAYPSGGETQVTDSYGHAANYFYDAAGRTTEEDDYTKNDWLKSYTSWDQALNAPTETVAANGGVTDYGWDSNANLIWLQEPVVQTSEGGGRPVARFSYDQYNNLHSYCDPQYVWNTGATSCPLTGGTMHYVWSTDNNATDSNEPYGRLTDVYNAAGYHRWIQYNTSSQAGTDYGLPTDAYGDCVSQNDATSRCPHVSVVYNALGNAVSQNTGAGTWTIAYDNMNRVGTVTDADGVANCTWHYANGQVSWHESPSERAASGLGGQCSGSANPDSTAQQFTYDADGNELTETHHFNNTATTTTNWYDGADRLVEVELPGDPNDIFAHWLTRYIYDASNSPSSGEYGNLTSVQRYIPNETKQTGTTVSAAYGWIGVKSWAYDALDRTTSYAYYSPGASAMSTSTWQWDTRGAGLLASYSNAVGDSVTLSYDAMGNVTRRDYNVVNPIYSGALPSETMTYDPDGRLAMYDNTEIGPAFYTYDGDGNVLSYKEPTGGNGTPFGGGITGAISDATTYNYAYYKDDSLSQLSASSATLSSYLQQYNYTVDGLLESQKSSANWLQNGTAYGDTYAWNESFSPAGRLTYKSDSIANPCPAGQSCRTLMSYCNSGCTQGAALNVGYDGYGRIRTWQIPEGTYSNFQYDAEGEPTLFDANSQQWTLGYSTRGELLTAGVTQSDHVAAYRSADGFLYSTTQICGTNRYGDENCSYPTQAFDPRNGALLSTQYYNGISNLPMTRSFSYDAVGRRTGQEYDALNRLLEVGTTSGIGYAYGPGTIPVSRSSYTNHASMGATPIYTTDSSNNVLDVKLGANNDILPTNTSFSGLTVYDRDPFGFIAASRNNGGSSGWNIPDMFSTCGAWAQVASATSGFVSTPMTNCAPAGRLYAYRTDGYFDGTLTFRGVRTYQGDTQQWSTPDMYQGMAGDPMSQMGYSYAGNNPAMFADPSGFCPSAWDSNGPGGSRSGPVSYVNCNEVAFDNCVIGCYGGGPSAMSIDMLINRLNRLLRNPCVHDALRSGGLTIGIDAVGLIPVLGGFTKLGKIAEGARAVWRVVGHQFGYVGAVADRQGKTLLQGASGISGLLVSAPAMTQGDKSAMLSGALGLAGFVPALSDVVAAGQTTMDIGITIKAVHDCVAH